MDKPDQPLSRSIQEFVPGKQVTIAHIIPNPNRDICERIGVDNKGAVGIMTISVGGLYLLWLLIREGRR